MGFCEDYDFEELERIEEWLEFYETERIEENYEVCETCLVLQRQVRSGVFLEHWRGISGHISGIVDSLLIQSIQEEHTLGKVNRLMYIHMEM